MPTCNYNLKFQKTPDTSILGGEKMRVFRNAWLFRRFRDGNALINFENASARFAALSQMVEPSWAQVGQVWSRTGLIGGVS